MTSSEGRYGGSDERVLVLLPESRDAGSMPRVLEVIGVVSMICATPEELCAEIDRGAGALLIEEEALSPRLGACLHATLDSQPSWSELPIIVLSSRGPESEIARDALLLPGDVTLVETPVRVNTLVTVVSSALRSRRRQYLVRDQLRALEESEEKLRRAKEDLEVRVRERTEALSRALAELRLETEERLRAVEGLRTREQMLMQQGRLAAMGEMLANISHQWRQPLNLVGLILQELTRNYKRGTFSEEMLEKSVARARELIAHMSQTIDDFRGFLQPQRSTAPFDVSEVIRKTVVMVEESMKGIAIDVLAEETVSMEGFANEFTQALMNILANARDAFRERGTVNPALRIRISREQGRGVVTITDNAGGIPTEILDRIFEPYFTTKPPDKGTGIGLFMSKTIIEKNMGGRLTVRNTGEGAEFRIEV